MSLSITGLEGCGSHVRALKDATILFHGEDSKLQKQRDEDGGEQSIADELCNQYLHKVVLCVTANQIRSTEHAKHAARNAASATPTFFSTRLSSGSELLFDRHPSPA